MWGNNISDSSGVAHEDVENRLMEKFKSGTEHGNKRKREWYHASDSLNVMYYIPPFISQCCLHSSPMSCCFKVTSHSQSIPQTSTLSGDFQNTFGKMHA